MIKNNVIPSFSCLLRSISFYINETVTRKTMQLELYIFMYNINCLYDAFMLKLRNRLYRYCSVFNTKLHISVLHNRIVRIREPGVNLKSEGTQVLTESRKSCGRRFTHPKGYTKITAKTQFQSEADTTTGAETQVNAKEGVNVEEQEKTWDWDSQVSCPLFHFIHIIDNDGAGDFV